MERDAVKNEASAQFKDILAGCIAGGVSKMCEYPLDTVKVLIQVSSVSEGTFQPSAFRVFRDTLAEGGILRVYRGISAPVFGAMGENLVSFWMFGAAERRLKKEFHRKELSILQIGCCGAFSGIGTGLWLTPVEFIKCQMQVSSTAARYHNSTLECMRHNLLRQPSNMFIGLSASWMREIPGSFVYFVSYRGTTRFLQSHFCSSRDKNPGSSAHAPSDDPPLWAVLAGGGMAGITFWTIIYPIDLIKSKQQSMNVFEGSTVASVGSGDSATVLQATHTAPRVESTYRLLVDRVKQYGFRSLYRGWGVAAVRAVVTNAIVFAAYEYSRKVLDAVIVDESLEYSGDAQSIGNIDNMDNIDCINDDLDSIGTKRDESIVVSTNGQVG